MLVASSVTSDARVLREAAALVQAGHEVHVVGKDVPDDKQAGDGIQISSATAGSGLRPAGEASRSGELPGLRRLARWVFLPEHRRLSFGHWVREAGAVAEELRFDVVHAHDYTALELGNRLARARNVPLVYDTHELWSERFRTGRPTPVWSRWERRVEERLGGAAAAVLTVGEALAGQLRAAYGWHHVTVVRNTFPADSSAPAVALETPRAAVYAGRLAAGRDLETVAAASRLVDMPVRLVGPPEQAWLSAFEPGRCSVQGAVELHEVDAEIRAAGLALVTLSDRWGNHRIALPNKLFHAVRVGVPVVATDVGELARTVREHGLGVLYRCGDAASLADALEEVRSRYAEFVAGVRDSAQHLSWDRDREALLRVYGGLSR